MRNSFIRIVSALTVATAAFVPQPVGANHCSDEEGVPHTIVIFSHPTGVNSNAVVCIATAEDTDALGYDGRIINPGSTAVSVRYTEDWGPEVPTLTGRLDGLGFNGRAITLRRAAVTGGGFVYDTGNYVIPDGRAASGSITATVQFPDGTSGANTFHTVV